jgi:hypothetical protein
MPSATSSRKQAAKERIESRIGKATKEEISVQRRIGQSENSPDVPNVLFGPSFPIEGELPKNHVLGRGYTNEYVVDGNDPDG